MPQSATAKALCKQCRALEMVKRRRVDTKQLSGSMARILDPMAISQIVDVDSTGLLHATSARPIHEDALLRFLQRAFERNEAKAERSRLPCQPRHCFERSGSEISHDSRPPPLAPRARLVDDPRCRRQPRARATAFARRFSGRANLTSRARHIP